jgi:hypothetical protein
MTTLVQRHNSLEDAFNHDTSISGANALFYTMLGTNTE